MHRVLRQPFLAATVLIGLALLSGCIGSTADCDALPSALEVTLTGTALTPPNPEVCRGADVTLNLHAEVDGIFHIHGYDAEVPATPVAAGEDVELQFTASRSGQFPMELHSDENTQGVNVGILTVHEP